VFLSDRVIVMGLRPSRIVADVPIGFPRPRDIHLQESPEFSGIVAMLRDHIGSQHG
jgi:NitT/TauT family transport system ATP-binding protein